MEFELRTVGNIYTEEGKERYEKLGFTFEPSQSGGQAYYKKNASVTINFDTLEELVEFSNYWGRLIIEPGRIEIYDDWRE